MTSVVNADEVITIHLKGTESSTKKISISDISKITFETGGFKVVTGNENYFEYNDVKKITFDESGENIETIFSKNSSLVASPNPTKDKLVIKGGDDLYGCSLYIYNLTGNLVSRHDNWNGETINISDLSSGIYFLNINSNTIKFIKQ